MRVFILYRVIKMSLCAYHSGKKLTALGVVVSVYSSSSKMSKPFKNSPLTVTAGYANGVAHVAVKPPATGERQGLVIALILDVSGSMQTNACKVGDAHLYHTRLDLLKLVAELLVRMLGPADTLTLITFSDNGRVLFPPALMTDEAKERAATAIKGMRTEGATNLWNSLEVTNEVMTRAEYMESLRYAIMLTDGEESYPAPFPNGTVGGFEQLPRSFVLNIFGFGADLDSAKLAALTQTAGGRFSNIADFMTLATTSINCMATGLATCSMGDTVTVTYEDGTSSEHKTSLVQFGQDRNIVFKTAKKPVKATLQRGGAVTEFSAEVARPMKARADMLEGIRAVLASRGSGADAIYRPIYARYPGLAEVTELNTELLSGSSNDNWNKWGHHYHWAYLQALDNDHRMNFKEVGQAHLGGADFEKYKTLGDSVFSVIPKPQPTGGSTAVPSYGGGYAAPRATASFANTNDARDSGGCWAPGSLVRMADGSRKAIERVEPGDKVWTDIGDAVVEFTLELGRHDSPMQNMCRVGNLLLTWYHPVKQGGIWVPPCTVAQVEAVHMPVVHNLIVNRGHILDIDGTLTVSLGHGLTEEGVKHDFFGSKERILDAIKGQPGFANQRVVYRNLVALRDPATTEIVGWKSS